MNTTILPTPPTSGAIVTGGYDRGYDNAVAELITNNNVADNGRAILTAIANGDAEVIAAGQVGHLANQKATMDASVAGINATNLNGVAGIKETSDASRDNIRETSRVGSDLGHAISDARSSVERTSAENRLATAIAAGEIRELIGKTGFDNLVAVKDNGFAVREEGCKTRETVLIDGCKTREQEAEHFSKLQYQAEKNKNDIEKEMLKGFHTTQLEAQKNACELAAKLAECCCKLEMEHFTTRALILAEGTKRLESENSNLRMELLLKKCGNSGNGNPGNGNN
jgi:hypothetical protein